MEQNEGKLSVGEFHGEEMGWELLGWKHVLTFRYRRKDYKDAECNGFTAKGEKDMEQAYKLDCIPQLILSF